MTSTADANERAVDQMVALARTLTCPDCGGAPRVHDLRAGGITATVPHRDTCPLFAPTVADSATIVVVHRRGGR